MTILFDSRGVEKPSGRHVVVGVGSLFNLRGSTTREYYFAGDDSEADLSALRNDWEAISADLNKSATQYRRTSGRPSK